MSEVPRSPHILIPPTDKSISWFVGNKNEANLIRSTVAELFGEPPSLLYTAKQRIENSTIAKIAVKTYPAVFETRRDEHTSSPIYMIGHKKGRGVITLEDVVDFLISNGVEENIAKLMTKKWLNYGIHISFIKPESSGFDRFFLVGYALRHIGRSNPYTLKLALTREEL